MSQRSTLLSRPHDIMTLPEGFTSRSVTLLLWAGLKDTHTQSLMRQMVIMPASLPLTSLSAVLEKRSEVQGPWNKETHIIAKRIEATNRRRPAIRDTY